MQSYDILKDVSVTAMFGLPQEVKSELKEKYGIEDAWPVVSPHLSVDFCNVLTGKGCPLCPHFAHVVPSDTIIICRCKLLASEAKTSCYG